MTSNNDMEQHFAGTYTNTSKNPVEDLKLNQNELDQLFQSKVVEPNEYDLYGRALKGESMSEKQLKWIRLIEERANAPTIKCKECGNTVIGRIAKTGKEYWMCDNESAHKSKKVVWNNPPGRK